MTLAHAARSGEAVLSLTLDPAFALCREVWLCSPRCACSTVVGAPHRLPFPGQNTSLSLSQYLGDSSVLPMCVLCTCPPPWATCWILPWRWVLVFWKTSQGLSLLPAPRRPPQTAQVSSFPLGSLLEGRWNLGHESA